MIFPILSTILWLPTIGAIIVLMIYGYFRRRA